MTNGQFQSKFFEEQTYITQYDTQRQELDKKNSDSQKLGGGNMDVVQVMLCKHSSDCRSHILHSSQIIAASTVSCQSTITKHQPCTAWERCTVPKIGVLIFWCYLLGKNLPVHETMCLSSRQGRETKLTFASDIVTEFFNVNIKKFCSIRLCLCPSHPDGRCFSLPLISSPPNAARTSSTLNNQYLHNKYFCILHIKCFPIQFCHRFWGSNWIQFIDKYD